MNTPASSPQKFASYQYVNQAPFGTATAQWLVPSALRYEADTADDPSGLTLWGDFANIKADGTWQGHDSGEGNESWQGMNALLLDASASWREAESLEPWARNVGLKIFYRPVYNGS